jgi:hypothetical protein
MEVMIMKKKIKVIITILVVIVAIASPIIIDRVRFCNEKKPIFVLSEPVYDALIYRGICYTVTYGCKPGQDDKKGTWYWFWENVY